MAVRGQKLSATHKRRISEALVRRNQLIDPRTATLKPSIVKRKPALAKRKYVSRDPKDRQNAPRSNELLRIDLMASQLLVSSLRGRIRELETFVKQNDEKIQRMLDWKHRDQRKQNIEFWDD